MLPYNINKIDLISMLHTDPEKGLTSDQVRKLIEEHGENKLKEARKKTNLQRFFDQFKDDDSYSSYGSRHIIYCRIN